MVLVLSPDGVTLVRAGFVVSSSLMVVVETVNSRVSVSDNPEGSDATILIVCNPVSVTAGVNWYRLPAIVPLAGVCVNNENVRLSLSGSMQ